ncbi:BA14K family protein [Brevundimonas sp. Root1279]|uniref:BA14K family protein n=1 Tax=Brevundimonas sp. Root1279 TaxID=1736443 RepID=UPI0006FA6971|nr:BA14K family protein [Brevundimonas sp. Root1279]KQW82616.1 hypothetical protein ASC65_10405 [Brevundimonas sp. Root1279]
MTRPIPTALLLAAGLALAAGSASAQSWGHDRYDRYERSGGYSNAAPSAFDWRSQLDRPGDYRCDAFWDANRTDCGARWRDQRGRSGYAPWNSSYRYGYSDYDRGYGYGHESGRRRDYDYGRNYGHSAGSTTYEGAYGRPDHVFPGGGRGGSYSAGRDPGRVDWCRANYRSYDPYSGYYRGYSGRLIFCG